MTPVVNIRRPTVDWGVNLQYTIVYRRVSLQIYTCSSINACTYTHARTRGYSDLFLSGRTGVLIDRVVASFN